MNNLRWIKIGFGILVVLMLFNIATFFHSIGWLNLKGPSATELIDSAITKIDSATHEINTAKSNIEKVYEDLDAAQKELTTVKMKVKEVNINYDKIKKIASEEIQKSAAKIDALRIELQTEKDSIEALRNELRKLK